MRLSTGRVLGIALVTVSGCERVAADPVDVTEPPATVTQTATRATPPPPPPAPERRGPPAQLAALIERRAQHPGAWIVTLRHPIEGQVRLAQPMADVFVTLLAAQSYTNGEYGCVHEHDIAITIERSGASLDLGYNCGHLHLTAAGHAGPWVSFSEEMEAFMIAMLAPLGMR